MDKDTETSAIIKRYFKQIGHSKIGRVFFDALFVLFVFICFPVGLYLLWKKKKQYSLSFKIVITSVVAIMTIIALLIATPNNMYEPNTIEYINISRDSNVYMPEVPDINESVVTYKNAYAADTVIVTPEPTKEPIYVWCNDMGKYYHMENCRYVKETTPRVTLQQALVGGFSACPDCQPPKS